MFPTLGRFTFYCSIFQGYMLSSHQRSPTLLSTAFLNDRLAFPPFFSPGLWPPSGCFVPRTQCSALLAAPIRQPSRGTPSAARHSSRAAALLCWTPSPTLIVYNAQSAASDLPFRPPQECEYDVSLLMSWYGPSRMLMLLPCQSFALWGLLSFGRHLEEGFWRSAGLAFC